MKAFFKDFILTEKFRLLVLAVVAFAAMSPVLFNGLPFGYDLPHHYQCAFTFAESIQAGDFYPAWSLNRNFGYGGMETRLYPPISHFTLALAFLAVGDWHWASWLTLFFFSFLGGLAVYLWAREYMSPWQAVFAGGIYVFLPYHLNQIYNTFFFAEFVGSSVLPLTFVFVSRTCQRGKTADILGLAISFAVLILTHLPLTVIGSICFAVYGLLLLSRERAVSQFLKLGAGVLLGLAASSFFWVKVVQERDLMAKTAIYPDPWLDYRFHFLLTPIQVFEGELRTRIYENSTFFYDLMFICPVLLVVAFAAPLFAGAKHRFRRMKGVWAVFILSIFLAVPFSRFVWDAAPLLQEVQFPWRWLAVVSVSASVLAAAGLDVLADWFQSKRRPLGLIVAGCLLAVVTFSISQIIRPAPIIPKAEVETLMVENKSKEGFIFWWTIWTRKEALEIKEKIYAGGRGITIQNWTAAKRDFEVGEGDARQVRVATFFHPNWYASVNGIPADPKPDEHGAILVSVPERHSKVHLEFVETFELRLAQWISGAAWLFLGVFICLSAIKRFLSSESAL